MLNKVAAINDKQVPGDIIQKFKVSFPGSLCYSLLKSAQMSGRWHTHQHFLSEIEKRLPRSNS